MIDEWCGGCKYHEYPYKAQAPLKIDGNYKNIWFRNDNDVWDIIYKLIQETKGVNEKMGTSFNISASVLSQLPFFACKNIIINPECQEDISRYTYCSNTNCSSYPGSYGAQPAKWVKKTFIIKNALQLRENTLKQKQLKENK